MNVERLHSLLLNAIGEIEDCNTLELIVGLRDRTQQLASNPQHPDIQRDFSDMRSRLMEALDIAASNSLSPGTVRDLENLNIMKYLGNSLADRIDTILTQNEITLAVASDQITQITTDLQDLYNYLKTVVVAFETLNIDKDEPAPGEVEASVMLPRSSINNSLRSLGAEFRELEQIFADVTELATGSRPSTSVRSIASSDFSVYLELAPEAAAFLAVAVERVIALYRNLLEIRRIRSEASAAGLSDDQLRGIDKHIAERMDQGVDETVDELFVEMEIAVSDDSRRNELKVSLRRSLSGVAARIDRGYQFDVRVGEILEDVDKDGSEVGERSSLASSWRLIENSREGLTFLRLEGDPILQLPSAEPSEIARDEEQSR
ncbi:MAG: hypothetical protein F4126_11095 [Acidimicrobiaceae bacterium]|nr:hypothetical protein [Acidimicrobiaceae bacterium]MYH94245.1 hypothetical protein [Acidimicrobiaceae bacterium]